MPGPRGPKRESFTAFRSAAEEADARAESENWPLEGGHMSSTSGSVMHVPGAELPYVATLMHQGRDATKQAFATMREAEAFIKRNTPVPPAQFSGVYDQAAPGSLDPAGTEASMNDEDILARLKVIDERLRRISAEEAASVLAGGLTSAGIHGKERIRLIAETERILDELDGTHVR
jgi:hypothetical protein